MTLHGTLPAAESEGPNDPLEPGLAEPSEGGVYHHPAEPDGVQEQPEAWAKAAGSADGTPTSQLRSKRGRRPMSSACPIQGVVADAALGQGGEKTRPARLDRVTV